MFDTLLTITLFLLASLLVCLLTLRLSININFLCLFLHSLPILRDFLKFRPPTPCLLNLTKISDPPPPPPPPPPPSPPPPPPRPPFILTAPPPHLLGT